MALLSPIESFGFVQPLIDSFTALFITSRVNLPRQYPPKPPIRQLMPSLKKPVRPDSPPFQPSAALILITSFSYFP